MLIFLLCFAQAAKAGERLILDYLKEKAIALQDESDLDALIESIGESRYVLLGESSHGTSDYYRWRAAISRRLIKEKGFSFIAVEGDWSACYEVNRYVKGLPGAKEDARGALSVFGRWPQWMWNNQETADLIEWMRSYNAELPPQERVGFYGIDLYAMFESIENVLAFFATTDPASSNKVQSYYACLLAYKNDPHAYTAAVYEGKTDCGKNVAEVISLLRENSAEYIRKSSRQEYFNAKQNARVVKNAEQHYKSMIYRGPASWNHRVRHFQLTVERLMEYYGPEARGIIWAHNTHVGDARQTSMAAAGMENIGQLIRKTRGEEDVFIVGFGTYKGRVLAGRFWGAPVEAMPVPPAIPGSFEEILNRLPWKQALFIFKNKEIPEQLLLPLGHRAKGVVYNPHDERGNYVPSRVMRRYDAFIFISRTEALTPF